MAAYQLQEDLQLQKYHHIAAIKQEIDLATALFSAVH